MDKFVLMVALIGFICLSMAMLMLVQLYCNRAWYKLTRNDHKVAATQPSTQTAITEVPTVPTQCVCCRNDYERSAMFSKPSRLCMEDSVINLFLSSTNTVHARKACAGVNSIGIKRCTKCVH